MKSGLMVRKKNGRLEPFDGKKMARAIGRAGTPYALALEVSRAVKDELSDREQVSSVTLRKMVAEELGRQERHDISKSYLGYKKAKPKARRHLQHKEGIRKTTKSRGRHAALTKDSNRGRPPRW
jgi:2-phosphoglycerate kinase